MTTAPSLSIPIPAPSGRCPADIDSTRAILETIRELSGDKYFLMIHGDPTYPIPTGDTMMEFSTMMYEEPEKIHEGTQERNVAFAQKLCDEMAQAPRPAGRLVPCAPTTASTSTPSTAGICSPNSSSPT